MPIGLAPYPWSVLPDSHWQALYQANSELIDDVLDDLRRLARRTSFAKLGIAAYLPPAHLFRYDERFLRKFLVCLTSVGMKLRLPDFHPLGCTAEELAVYAMKRRAAEILEEQDEEAEFARWDEVALEDADHELLYVPAYDGIENLPQVQAMALAHLPFDEWFLPFNPSRVMHHYAQPSIGEEPPWAADRALYPAADEDDEDGVDDAEGG